MGYKSMARLISIVLLFALLCAGPGWALDAPLPNPMDSDMPMTASPVWVAQEGQAPVESLRLERPQQKLSFLDREIDGSLLDMTPRPSTTNLPAHPFGSVVPSPALHLRLCVFLC